jgi:hypothetical protein
MVQDSYNTANNYTFNVCGNVAATDLPADYTVSPPSMTGKDLPAFQLDIANKIIYTLGQDASVGWNFSFIDPQYPNWGVNLAYTGGSGEWCRYYDAKYNLITTQRSLRIAMQCDGNRASNTFDAEELVLEEDKCHYAVSLKTIFGCPTACWTEKDEPSSVCNGKGVCGYDTDRNAARCFCYAGYAGATCDVPATNEKPSSGSSAITVLFIITAVALFGVLAGIGYAVWRLRKLQVDPSAYGGLEGRFNELIHVVDRHDQRLM